MPTKGNKIKNNKEENFPPKKQNINFINIKNVNKDNKGKSGSKVELGQSKLSKRIKKKLLKNVFNIF